MSGMTLAEAESTTTGFVDGVIASIGPSSVERVDVVTNETLSCRGSEVDPEGKVRVWENLRYVWLRDGTNKLELLDTLVTAAADEGWELVRDKAANADGGRRVQLQGTGDRAEYVLQFVSGAEGDGQNVVYVASGSPCFEVPVDDR